jgi:hypothetical protein
VAHILPDQPRDWRDFRMATPAPQCPHGVPYPERCSGCGWVCPTCKRAYAPWVRECNYSHEDDWQRRAGVQPGTFTPVQPVPADEPAEVIPAIYVPLRDDADVTPSRMADIAHMLTHVAPDVIAGKFIVLPPGAKTDAQ